MKNKNAKNSLNRFLSVIISIIMVITMVPVFMFSSVAVTSTKNLTADGIWQHKISTDNTDGRGANYVSSHVKYLNYYFMQTTDNQEFTFTTTLDFMKNDGINSATLFSVDYSATDSSTKAFKQNRLLSTSWKNQTLNGNTYSTPTNVPMPGSFGSGYASQLKNKVYYWDCAITFKGNDSNTYGEIKDGFSWVLSYKSGDTSYNQTNHNTADDNENIAFTLNITDARELIKIVERAKEIIESGKLTQAQTDSLQAALNTVANSHMTDGTVYFTQAKIDDATAIIGSFVPADFTEYNTVISQAEEILLNENRYSADDITSLKQSIANEDEILMLTDDEQDTVDSATKAIKDILNILIISSVDEPNTGVLKTSSNLMYLTAIWKNTSAFPYTPYSSYEDGISLTLNHNKVYMDISEDLSDANIALTYTYSSQFAWGQTVSGPLTNNSLNKKIAGKTNKSNYTTYFDYETTSANGAALVSDTAYKSVNDESGAIVNYKFYLNGSPKAVTGDSGVKIYLNTYAYYFGFTITDTRISDKSGSFKRSAEQSNFTLIAYDKSSLKTAINEAAAIEYNGADNWVEFQSTIRDAIDNVYNVREVTQSQIDAAVATINNFVFNYTVTASVSPEGVGTINDVQVYTTTISVSRAEGSKDFTLTVTPATDYALSAWSDGSTTATITKTISNSTANNLNYVANLYFVVADYTAVDSALALIPANIDSGLYTLESVNAIKQAESAVVRGLGASNQTTVDGYANSINSAISGLIYNGANYTALDKAIESADAVDLNNVFEDNNKTLFINALESAKNCDRGLNISSQSYIDSLLDSLTAATNSIGYYCEYSNLENAVTSNIVTAKDENKYTPEAWQAYEEALTNAQSLINNDKLINDADGVNQKAIDDATSALETALQNLANSKYCEYSNLETAVTSNTVTAQDENKYTPEAWQAYEEALTNAQALINNDKLINDANGVNQKAIDDAMSALESALQNLANNKYIVVNVHDDSSLKLDTIYTGTTTIGDLNNQLTVEDKDKKSFIGWADNNGNVLQDSYQISGDMDIFAVYEYNQITPKISSAIKVDHSNHIVKGLKGNSNNVQSLKSQLENDSTLVIIKDRNGKLLSDNDKVGTGATISLVSAYDHGKVYESTSAILYGDVDGDGNISDIDFTKLIMTSIGADSFSSDEAIYKTAADINNDGVVDGFDAALTDSIMTSLRKGS